MQTSIILRQYAEECLRVAAAQGSEKVRQFLVEMAAHWHELAQEREDRPNDPKTADPFQTNSEYGG